MASKKEPNKNDSNLSNLSKKSDTVDTKSGIEESAKTVPTWLFVGVSLFVCFGAIILGSFLTYDHLKNRNHENTLPFEQDESRTWFGPGYNLFKLHDTNKDGYLSPSEFEIFFRRLVESNFSNLELYSPKIDNDDEVITIYSHFIPLRLETMTKEQNTVFGSSDTLHGLKTWLTPAIANLNFGAHHFQDFLPNYPKPTEVGKVYWIIEPPAKTIGSLLSSNRYYPRKIEGPGVIIHRLLTLFHPHPFVMSRFAPQGSVATVRAINEQYVEIVFRIHAEFQLNDPPYYPMWFTPAQFTGSIIMKKDSSSVISFNMVVPTDRKLNVDMEWLNGPDENENMEVDLGYLPLMALNNSAPSKKILEDEHFLREMAHLPDPDFHKVIKNIKWNEEITHEKALNLLEKKMYPFKKVPYYNFTTALDKASVEHKFVHSIILWGALDDQSC